ncbi:membrane dipeptidase [Lutimaribacter pacificus]|uniref:Dipeptidase AC. Metallo peptidase. MEROPS family M19 n=1 Tax=Lutimaribacter pacificus TaxID=391948 RepID=A0A1H0EM14_9RHOB|nr:membrane dipeptidase [Lutimaribacter pacificus]SDN83391.1 membrane dipeptidase [Lutimaribacter pacificus]SHK51468.1 dipeptidase AC. Metallo peptidase. MEROPS family M19 [Lutimaribacter pacificus]
MTEQIRVFDGHNDALLRLWRGDRPATESFAAPGPGHITIPRAQAGGFGGGFFAMFALDQARGLDFAIFDNPPYDTPLPPEMDRATAWSVIEGQARIAQELDKAGQVWLCKSGAELRRAWNAGDPMAMILHLEGAECIGPDLEGLDTLYDLGLRSVGPVWSRPTAFAHGVPFRYPSDGDTGPGLTDAGRALVRECVARRMVVDCSHMTMKGFYDVAGEGAALVATHSNAHAVSPSARNLTDDQLRAIGETGGMAGLNFGTVFLRPDGRRDAAGALDHAIAHLDRMIEMAGEDHVGLGSDFDGAPMPEGLDSAADLPVLVRRMLDAGYGDALIVKLCHENWLRFLERTLP